ncbi:transmembrane protein 134 isoform X8 [Sus scrofa]|uniref:transmembrane protein 134 isoform X8 n=1 Tax=Sus scrofa TaxID=9823 RepID=UPI000A2B6A4F|nr:transmembrane protein 134 isoform X8 [Sus scrofa]
MTPSNCPWRTRAPAPSPAESPASGRCTSSAGPGSRWPRRTSSPACATRDSGRTSIRSSQWSFSTISSSTQRSYNACCSWTQHPLIQKNRRVVLASFLLLLLGLGPPPCHQLLPPAPVLTLAAPSVCSADPDRRGTGGGPLARCLQRHLLRARLPVAGPGSLPRDLHLLRCQGPPGLPVLLPALLREVSCRRTARIQHRFRGAPCGLLAFP